MVFNNKYEYMYYMYQINIGSCDLLGFRMISQILYDPNNVFFWFLIFLTFKIISPQ